MKDDIIKTITEMFIATDERNWDHLRALFCDKVVMDYSSFSGGEPDELTPEQILDSWKTVIPNFKSTHHQIGNIVIVRSTHDIAEVYCYVTATHLSEKDQSENLWVVYGSYDFELHKSQDKWYISKMRFNYKFSDGNSGLS